MSAFVSQSFNSDGSKIDEQSNGIVYQVTTPYSLPASKVTINTGSGEINMLDKYSFTIDLPLPLPVGTVIEMTIPPTISIFSDSQRMNAVLNNASGYLPFFQVPQVTILDPVAQKIRITNLVPNQANYIDETNQVRFELLWMKNPGSTQ